MARRPKELFQDIVGARQARNLVASEEAVPITLRDFPELHHCWSERPQPVLLLCHGLEQLLIVLLQSGDVVLLGVGEQVSGLVQPCVGLLERRPEGLCRL
jgi:hypothetical protein